VDDRYARGRDRLDQLDPGQIGQVVDGLKDIAPDFGKFIVEFAFGDIYSRPGLDLRSRQIANIAALTALGTAPAQLQVHIRCALNVGCSRQEIVEVLMQMAIYAGFPAALNGLAAARQVFSICDQSSA
jgi:4-carboxymuconolactone decarboxylase